MNTNQNQHYRKSAIDVLADALCDVIAKAPRDTVSDVQNSERLSKIVCTKVRIAHNNLRIQYLENQISKVKLLEPTQPFTPKPACTCPLP